MPVIRFPASYPLPKGQGALLQDPDELEGFDPTAVGAGDPTPIPPSPSSAADAQEANSVSLPPLDKGGKEKKFKLPPGRNGAMPPPEAEPPAPPQAAAPAQPSPAAAAGAPTEPPTGAPPPDMAAALAPPTGEPKSTAEQLAGLQKPEPAHDNVAQRLARAVMSFTRFAPIVNQVIHPKYAEQMRDYQGQRADLEAKLGEEKTQAGIEAEAQRAEAYAAQKNAQAANYAQTQETRAASAKERLEAAFEKAMGPDAVPLNPGQEVPDGFAEFKNPISQQSWIRRSPVVNLPPELSHRFPGMKPGSPITRKELDTALQAEWKEQLENTKAGNKSDPKQDPNQWIVDADNPNPEISGPAKAHLRGLSQLKQSERPIFQMPGSVDAPSSMAQAIAEYQQQFPIVRTTSPQALAQADALMKQVKAINPDYHQEYYNTFQKTENDATTGKLATSANSFNTMIGHLTLLKTAADALKNNNIQVLNGIANQWGIQTGQDPVTIFQTIVHRIGPETARAYIGAGGDVSDRQKMEEDFSKNASPDQIYSAIRTAALLGKGKMDENVNQYMRGTYGRGKQKLLSDEARTSLQGLVGNASNQVVVNLKSGKTATFSSQQAADAFRKDHPDRIK